MEEKFQSAFPDLTEENWKTLLPKNDLDITQVLYSPRLKNLSGYMDACHFCYDKKCEGCPLPYDEEQTFNDLLKKLGV